VILASLGQLLGDDSFALFRSRDGGETRTRASQGLPTFSRINAVHADRSWALAGTDAGLFRSDDEGGNWNAVSVLPGAAPRILAITVHADRIFLGTDRHGLIASVDQGKTWERKVGLAATKIRSLHATGTRLYAGTDADGVQLSEDAGRNWTPLRKGWPALGQAFALSEVGGRIHAALYSQGLHRWNQEAGTWERVGNVVPLALAAKGGTLIAGHNPGGLHASHDAGANWEQGRIRTAPHSSLFDTTEPSQDGPVWEMAGDAERVLAGVGPGILRTTDRGRTWDRLTGGLPEEAPGIAFWVRGVRVFAAVRLPDRGVEPAKGQPAQRPTPSHPSSRR
jgi:photosystem II stability/assembly factor-like uncharacterized protein